MYSNALLDFIFEDEPEDDLIDTDQLCLDYRHDILYRVYVLSTENRQAWKDFCDLESNSKVEYKKLYSIYKSIKRHGQKTPIHLKWHNEKYYPASGATRLSCILALGIPFVRGELITECSTRRWDDAYLIDSKHFDGLNEDTLSGFRDFLEQQKGALIASHERV